VTRLFIRWKKTFSISLFTCQANMAERASNVIARIDTDGEKLTKLCTSRQAKTVTTVTTWLDHWSHAVHEYQQVSVAHRSAVVVDVRCAVCRLFTWCN